MRLVVRWTRRLELQRRIAGNADSKGCRKIGLCIPHVLLQEMETEAQRLNQPLSWLVREAGKKTRPRIATFPVRSRLPEREGFVQLAAGRSITADRRGVSRADPLRSLVSPLA